MADRGGLENRCTFAGTVGSNPTPSAIHFQANEINGLGSPSRGLSPPIVPQSCGAIKVQSTEPSPRTERHRGSERLR